MRSLVAVQWDVAERMHSVSAETEELETQLQSTLQVEGKSYTAIARDDTDDDRKPLLSPVKEADSEAQAADDTESDGEESTAVPVRVVCCVSRGQVPVNPPVSQMQPMSTNWCPSGTTGSVCGVNICACLAGYACRAARVCRYAGQA